MAGNKAGAQKAMAKVLAANPKHFSDIGKIGGSAKRSKPSGFAYMKIHNPAGVRAAAQKGGKQSVIVRWGSRDAV